MGVSRLGAKKLKRLETFCAEPLLAAFTCNNDVKWIECVTAARPHRHLFVDRGRAIVQLDERPTHFYGVCPDERDPEHKCAPAWVVKTRAGQMCQES